MLLDELRAEPALAYFIKSECCDQGICVDFDPAIPATDFVIIKVDDFYADAIRAGDRPKSPDCLIVQRCADGKFHWFVVELKSVQSQGSGDLKREEIWEKFHTCLTDFMSNRFRQFFYNPDYEFNLHLVLVAGKMAEKFKRNFDFKFLLGLKPLYFANKIIGVQGENPNPLVRPC
ncbi:MAG: hypothetical protein AAB316_16685 [Bacteroidota bacterium]